MSRFAFLSVALCALVSTVFASPMADDAMLSKRVTHEGEATWYDTGLGACGYTDSNSDPVVAISHLIYGDGGNCNQWIHITNTATGISQYGKTRDECEGCDEYHIDLSPSLFESLGAPLSQGVISEVKWHFMAKDFSP